MAKNLVLYFSHTGENYFGGTIKSVSKGNTAIAAEIIAAQVDGDLFELVPEVPYSENYRECVKQASAEWHEQARPAVHALPDVSGYDTIYLGYPNWCGTFPMCVATVLESLDFAGKTIRPFCTNEGSGMGSSERDLANLVPAAHVGAGLSINGGHAAECADKIAAWVK